MNQIIDTIKPARCEHHTVTMGRCQLCGHVFQLPVTFNYDRPDWATALVVRDNESEYWSRSGQYWQYACNTAYEPYLLDSDDLKRLWGPLTVVIDKVGNNVEAERLRAEAIEFADEWEPLRDELNEAIRARETAQRDLRKAHLIITHLEAQVTSLQAEQDGGH